MVGGVPVALKWCEKEKECKNAAAPLHSLDGLISWIRLRRRQTLSIPDVFLP